MRKSNPRETLRFGDFELDVAGYELRGSGRPIRLERQPMDLLIMLVEQRGQLLSREDIVDRLWGKDVFVDVETGVHTAVRKIRRALRDSPEKPAFIETVSGKGYRFIAPVRWSLLWPIPCRRRRLNLHIRPSPFCRSRTLAAIQIERTWPTA